MMIVVCKGLSNAKDVRLFSDSKAVPRTRPLLSVRILCAD